MHEYAIRMARTDDLPLLQELYRQLAEAEYALDTPHRALLPPIAERVRQLWGHLEALGSESSIWFVVPGSQSLIGSVCVRELLPSPVVVPAMEIRDVVVDRHHRCRGIGGALLEHAFAWGRASGMGGAMLEVAEANTAALSLYAAHGMYPTGRTLVRDLTGEPLTQGG
jgi:ribosomal protein S18 acetylase RimI-like enzyme